MKQLISKTSSTTLQHTTGDNKLFKLTANYQHCVDFIATIKSSVQYPIEIVYDAHNRLKGLIDLKCLSIFYLLRKAAINLKTNVYVTECSFFVLILTLLCNVD
ncbi:hypothetical protein ACKWTF_012852 [Chironomus riparius]